MKSKYLACISHVYSKLMAAFRNEMNENGNINWSPEAIAAFTNLLISHIKITSADLESFAKHGRRATVNPEDVKLLARRNESLEAKLSEFISNNK